MPPQTGWASGVFWEKCCLLRAKLGSKALCLPQLEGRRRGEEARSAGDKWAHTPRLSWPVPNMAGTDSPLFSHRKLEICYRTVAMSGG